MRTSRVRDSIFHRSNLVVGFALTQLPWRTASAYCFTVLVMLSRSVPSAACISSQRSIPLLPVGCSQNRLLWHGFASSALRWGFSMPGEPGKKRNKPELMPKPYAAARSAITRWLQPALTMSRIAKQQCAETSGPKGRLLQSNVEVRIEEEV